MSKRIFGYIRVIAFVVTFVLGFVVFFPLYDGNISNTAFASVRLFFLNTGEHEITPLLDVARWLGFFVMGSSVVSLLAEKAGVSIVNFVKCFHPASTAIYGDTIYAKHLKKDIGWTAMLTTAAPIFRAKKHVIMLDSDKKSLDFYAKHRNVFKDRDTTIILDNVTSDCMHSRNLHVFSMTENCAEEYWKNNIATENEKIAIIGFGSLGQAILEAGLLLNIVSTRQNIEYHVWGECTNYRGIHPQLFDDEGYLQCDKKDKVIFHNESWQCGLEQESGVNRIILCGTPNDNLRDLSSILRLFCCESCTKIYIYTEDRIECFADERIAPFGMAEALFTKEIVLEEKLLENAKNLHFQYNKKDRQMWDSLSTFLKRSNITAADYAFVINTHLKELKVHELAELEHIRWCRFHFMHNFRYGEVKNEKLRTHNKLVLYENLLPEDKVSIEKHISSLLKKVGT